MRCGTYLLAFFLFFLSYWINRYFGTPDLEQIAYHLSFGVDGLSASDPVFIRRFIRWCVIAQRGYAEFDGVVECTAEEIAEFVRFVKDNGYLDNTNIVILGDHLARKNPATDTLASQPERHVFNTFISADPLPKNREEILHFDLFPTILEFTGFDVRGNRLGLGYGAFNQHAHLPPATRFDEMQQSLLNSSEAYLALWQPSHLPDQAR